jgi:hypothetical protein
LSNQNEPGKCAGDAGGKTEFTHHHRQLTFTSFGRDRMLDFPSGTILAFSNSTSHGDGGPWRNKSRKQSIEASQLEVRQRLTIWYPSSGSVDESNVKSPNSTKPDSFGWNRRVKRRKSEETLMKLIGS